MRKIGMTVFGLLLAATVQAAEVGSIPGDVFNRALTKIWLGDNAVQPDLKKAMLGG